MKTIFRVARAELLNLFYSPVAWLVIIFYFIVCGLGFTEPMENLFRYQKVMMDAGEKWSGFDANGLSQELTGHVLYQLITNLYLFIPLLTMGVINREVNSGTMKLLYSSPIRTRDIVLGKYMGLLTLILFLVIIVAIFIVSASLIIINPEINKHFAAILGVFLVANAYIAIGLFISCLTNYQIVAGVLTFVVFFILNSISGLWQQYDFIRDLTYFMSIAGRANYLLSGLVSTRDIFYFILISVLFLGFALIKLKSTQESKPWTVSFFRYTTFFIVILLLGYISGRPGQVAYWDLSKKKMNTIAPNVQAALKEMDGSPLTITLYTNLLAPNGGAGLPQNRNYYLWQIWEQYRRFYPNMKFKYVYYYDIYEGNKWVYRQYPNKDIHQIAALVAKELGVRKSIFLKPDEIRKQIDLKDEGALLTMLLEYKGKKTWLRTYRDQHVWPMQPLVAGAITRLTRDSIPKIQFVSGHYERSPYSGGERNYESHVTDKSSRNSLFNLGVDADTISLLSANISNDVAALIVADPKAAMQPAEQEKVKSYLQNGGNAVILGEINKQQLLNPILNSIGVNLDSGTVVNPNAHEMPHILAVHVTDSAAYMADESKFYSYRNGGPNKLRAMIEGGVNISYKEINGFRIEPIMEFREKKNSWIENSRLVVDSAAPTFSATEGDVKYEKYVIGIKMSRTINNKEQRIVVIGDADILTPFRIGDINHTFYSWVLYNRYPFYINYPAPKDTLFKVAQGTTKTLKMVYIYVIPVALLVSAIVLLARRRRK